MPNAFILSARTFFTLSDIAEITHLTFFSSCISSDVRRSTLNGNLHNFDLSNPFISLARTVRGVIGNVV